MKSGFVVIVGRSNVGKSTLLNTLVGTKIAATSFRAQMTRHIIHGVMNTPDGQAVFVDTPGVLKAKKSKLTAKLLHKVEGALSDIDVIIYVVDPTKEIGDEERHTFGLIRNIQTPKILVINKSDLHEENRKYQLDYQFWGNDFNEVLTLSALKGSHIQPLRDRVMELLPEGDPLYPENQLTNIDNYFWIAEIVREKAFSIFEKEVPYSLNVEIDSVEETEDLIRIEGKILTNDERYKKMIIGKGANKVKEIGQMARKELEQSTNKKVYLGLEVEVDKHWVERI
ncbi:MAG: GTPase Era [Candidatus Magasanikbacteria bacterium CG11_big_fil_rev_8_21_14_0_20_39_34]|uniref:GTPase Era n=1 Tax=Candidatus Magasanikbacteria bacterium CG11_big_fil_rev_8_21_14_0_20_39_34 TaxID=1974653 RepID=A0A2H0N5F9_9BACT|nr:MAG: GTPase Era [Candidatus Magasanikbacteria bacterium CG11_big_fil_rev_8_21_14_0_20_39_34]